MKKLVLIMLMAASLAGCQKDNPTPKRIPAGTTFGASVMSGVEIGLGEMTIKAPAPILFKLDDNALLPEGGSCHVIGEATGSSITERANARTQTLSCVSSNGKTLEIPVQAYVVDSDGTAGVRGDRVTRSSGQTLIEVPAGRKVTLVLLRAIDLSSIPE